MFHTSYAELAHSDCVHRRVYTDPGIFEAEMQRIYGRTWVFVAHESEVPNPGDFKTDTFVHRPIIVVRGSDGRVRVLANTCPHRGSRVCYEDYGSASRFRCMYHGWTFSTEGRLIGVPMRERFENFNPDPEFGLVPLPRVDSHRGFIFASLSADGPTLREHLGAGMEYLDEFCDRAPDGTLGAGKPIKYGYAGNWKLQLENYADPYHAAVLHQSALEVGRTILKDKYTSTAFTPQSIRKDYRQRGYGLGHGMADFGHGRGANWMNAYLNPAYYAALREKYAEERARELLELDVHLMIYPNLLMHSRANHYRVIKPIAVDRTDVWAYPCRLGGAPKDVNDTLMLNTSHHVSAMGEVQVDDMQAFHWVQSGLQNEGMEWVLFKLGGANWQEDERGQFQCESPSEGIIRYQYREWARLMGANEVAVRIPRIPVEVR
jgi:phenylpropionate dioxygenase-like ring-hydroxylating dioxygenase large terminal subunit